MYGSVQNSHQNSNPQYGYLVPVQVNERRVYNPQVMDQRHYIPQVVQYFHHQHHQPQMSNSPHKRNTSLSRSLIPQNTPLMLNNMTSSQYLMPSNSFVVRSNAPTFNSHVPVDYKRMFNGTNQTNESGSRHAPISQMPSTFAMASNSILKRAEMTGNPLTSSLGDYSGLNSQHHYQHQNQYQGNKNYSRQQQQEDSSPYHNIQRTSVSHTNLPTIHHSSPTKSDRDRDTDRIRKPSVLENHQGFYRNQARHYDALDSVEEVSHRGSNRPERREQHAVLVQQRSSQDLNPNHHQQRRQDPYAHLSHANRNEGVPAYRQDLRPSTMNNALLRPTTIRITIASPNLTNMGLRGLRSSFESDDAFTDEVFRINDFINQMFGRSAEGETNWVSAFIQQFLNQIEDTNAKPVGITEDALSKLKTKKFKKKKSKKNKAKSTDESSTPDENPCAICLVDYEEGDELCSLSCEHDFHKDCITAWLKKKAECPTCRKAIE